MTDSDINEIVVQLPECQRELARRKIMQAQSLGWTNIILDPPQGGKPHHYDLLGIAPVSQKPTCLPDADDVIS